MADLARGKGGKSPNAMDEDYAMVGWGGGPASIDEISSGGISLRGTGWSILDSLLMLSILLLLL